MCILRQLKSLLLFNSGDGGLGKVSYLKSFSETCDLAGGLPLSAAITVHSTRVCSIRVYCVIPKRSGR